MYHLASGTEIPFKIKFFEILDNPILLPAELSFKKTTQQATTNCCSL